MATSDFRQNLALVTSYGRSVSDVCRRAGINRQQYNRYLSGQSSPSLSTLRRICDFFGLDDHEIFLDHESFANIIRRRPPRLKKQEDAITEFVRLLVQTDQNKTGALEKYEGYFQCYAQIEVGSEKLLRTLICVRNSGNGWVSKTIERYPTTTYMIPNRMNYKGVVFLIADRLVMLEQESTFRKSTWTTMMYTTDFDEPNFLSGLSIGISPENTHDIICYRTVWHYLGKTPDLRDAITKCGLIDLTDPTVPDYVPNVVGDAASPGPILLTPRS